VGTVNDIIYEPYLARFVDLTFLNHRDLGDGLKDVVEDAHDLVGAPTPAGVKIRSDSRTEVPQYIPAKLRVVLLPGAVLMGILVKTVARIPHGVIADDAPPPNALRYPRKLVANDGGKADDAGS